MKIVFSLIFFSIFLNCYSIDRIDPKQKNLKPNPNLNYFSLYFDSGDPSISELELEFFQPFKVANPLKFEYVIPISARSNRDQKPRSSIFDQCVFVQFVQFEKGTYILSRFRTFGNRDIEVSVFKPDGKEFRFEIANENPQKDKSPIYLGRINIDKDYKFTLENKDKDKCDKEFASAFPNIDFVNNTNKLLKTKNNTKE